MPDRYEFPNMQPAEQDTREAELVEDEVYRREREWDWRDDLYVEAGVTSDVKQPRRIVDPDCLPLFREVIDCGHPMPAVVTKHHVVSRAQGGDDLPENLVWVTGDGTTGVHGVLESRCRDGATGITYLEAAVALIAFVEARPELLGYVERKKYPGWLTDRYLCWRGFVSPLEKADWLRAQGRDEEADLIEEQHLSPDKEKVSSERC